MNTCRFCGITSMDGAGLVKYGTRHYAHFRCYLHAGKTIDALPAWKVGEFPYRLLEEYNLLDHPKIAEVKQLERDMLALDREHIKCTTR